MRRFLNKVSKETAQRLKTATLVPGSQPPDESYGPGPLSQIRPRRGGRGEKEEQPRAPWGAEEEAQEMRTPQEAQQGFAKCTKLGFSAFKQLLAEFVFLRK